MSTAVYPTGAAIVTKTKAASFIPEIWTKNNPRVDNLRPQLSNERS